jgi:hypothetical protein
MQILHNCGLDRWTQFYFSLFVINANQELKRLGLIKNRCSNKSTGTYAPHGFDYIKTNIIKLCAMI